MAHVTTLDGRPGTEVRRGPGGATMFEGRVALVTGGASGIGRAIVTELAARGARVALLDVDGAALRVAAEEVGDGALPLEGDVAREDDVRRAVEAVDGRWSRLDMVVNCAGIVRPERLATMGEAQYDRVVDVDLKGVYLVTRAALPLMERHGGGAVVNVSSVMAWYTAPGYVAYTAAKAGVVGMTRAMAVELGASGVRVNVICPGFIDTPIWHRNLAAKPADEAEAFAARIAALHPMGRRGRPDDVAKATAFLLSDDAAFITGATLVVDGGVSTNLVGA
jgi:NAD(P)-dependent dehydrogenase (short-subunit alcohol dehydrogenase family)